MLEKPNLSDQSLLESLHAAYGLSADTLEFLPIGNDSNAWVYRVQDGRWFLKVRRTLAEKSLHVPYFLHAHGIEQVIPPLATHSGALSVTLDEYHLILYPYVDGEIAFHKGMSAAQWTEFGDILRRIHQMPIDTLKDVVPQETFILPALAMVDRVAAAVRDSAGHDPLQAELAAAWQVQQDVIAHLLQRGQELSAELRHSQRPVTLCHADIHTFNLLIDRQDRLWIVDWDETLLAPPERDLMFVRGEIGIVPVYAEQEQHFYQGYGAYTLDQTTLAYYRYDWALQEIADYGKRVFFMPELNEPSRQYALKMFRKMFAAGDVVEAALIAG